MKSLSITIMLLFVGMAHSFGQQTIAEEARANAHSIIDTSSKYINGNSYLLFSIANSWYLLVVENGDRYEEYYLKNDSLGRGNMQKGGILRGYKRLLKKAFDNETYHREYVDLNSPFFSDGYDVSSGNATYFYLKDKDGNLYGESSLTTIISPNPIDKEIYCLLLIRLLKYIESDKL